MCPGCLPLSSWNQNGHKQALYTPATYFTPIMKCCCLWASLEKNSSTQNKRWPERQVSCPNIINTLAQNNEIIVISVSFVGWLVTSALEAFKPSMVACPLVTSALRMLEQVSWHEFGPSLYYIVSASQTRLQCETLVKVTFIHQV